jgi:hypothetical protein
MHFFLVAKKNDPTADVQKYFKTACKNNSVDYEIISPESFSYLENSIEKGDLVYRTAIPDTCCVLEKYLMSKGCVSLRTSNKNGNSYDEEATEIVHDIPTIPDFMSNEALLEKYVETLGGFPIIVKVQGGSKGV